MATSLSETTANIILRNKIHVLKLNITAEKEYLQELDIILQPLIKTKETLDRAINAVKEIEDIEERKPSLTQDLEWRRVREEAKSNQSWAKRSYARLREESQPVLKKYREHTEKLWGFEADYQRTVLLLDNLSRSWQKIEVDSSAMLMKENVSIDEFNKQRLPLESLAEQTSTTVYLKF